MQIEIDVYEVALELQERGIDISDNDFEGWTDILVDILEDFYGLETALVQVIDAERARDGGDEEDE